MSTHGLVHLLVHDLGSKGQGVALFDVVHRHQPLRLMLTVIGTRHTLASIAQVTGRKTLTIQLQTPRLLA